jgi:protein ERP2
MLGLSLHIFVVCIIFLFKQIVANELTFELPDNAKECFHEQLKIGSKFMLEFQVCLYQSLF